MVEDRAAVPCGDEETGRAHLVHLPLSRLLPPDCTGFDVGPIGLGKPVGKQLFQLAQGALPVELSAVPEKHR